MSADHGEIKDFLREMEKRKDTGLKLVMGEVLEASDDGTFIVSAGGSDVQIPGVRSVSPLSLKAGDTTMMVKNGPDMFIMGAPGASSSTIYTKNFDVEGVCDNTEFAIPTYEMPPPGLYTLNFLTTVVVDGGVLVLPPPAELDSFVFDPGFDFTPTTLLAGGIVYAAVLGAGGGWSYGGTSVVGWGTAANPSTGYIKISTTDDPTRDFHWTGTLTFTSTTLLPDA